MIKRLWVLGKFAICVLMLLLVWQLGCKTDKSEEPQELPITTSSDEARELFIEARNLQEFGHPDKAEKLYDQALEKDPNFALAWIFKAGIAIETGDFQAYLKKALELASTTSEGEQKLLAAYQAFYNENDRVKTNQIYQELTAMYPNDVRLHWYLGNSYSGLNKKEDALASWHKGLTLDPEFAPLHERLGYFYRAEEEYDNSEASFKEYVRLAPEEANGYDCLADLYRRMGRFDEALDHYNKAFEMDSSFQASAYKAATTLFFLGKFDEARQGLMELMELRTEPGLKVYDMQGIGRSHIFEGDYAKALEANDKIIEMAEELGLPEEASFSRMVKSLLQCELKEYDAAEASLNDCADFLEKSDLVAFYKNNQLASVTFWRAWIAKERGDFENALKYTEEYKAQLDEIGNPNYMKYYPWLLATIALAQDDPTKALEHFDQTEVDWVLMMYYQGLAKEKAGDMEGSKALFEKVANWNFENLWTAYVRRKAAAKL
jgi:tetratricopeptide (TPR) repeat protein